MKPPEPGARLGRYRLVRRLGAGAMGEVWEADDPELGRRVAVKLLRREVSAGRARMQREGRAMARLAHPDVIAVYDVGDADGQLFVAMELVGGGTLREWMATPRTWRAVVEKFVAAGRGLAAAHGAGLVHRDFKPDNVLLRSDGRVAVSDFGLARLDPSLSEIPDESETPPALAAAAPATDPEAATALQEGATATEGRTVTDVGATSSAADHAGAAADHAGAAADADARVRGHAADALSSGTSDSTADRDRRGQLATITDAGRLVGTPAYMAPEQHLGRVASAASDQFAFCVTLWEALHGERPFTAEKRAGLEPVVAMGLAIIGGKLRPPPRDVAVPGWLRRAVTRGLETEPEKRYPSMAALVAALERGLARRRRVLLGAAFAVVIAAGAAVALWPRAAAGPSCADPERQLAGVWDAPR